MGQYYSNVQFKLNWNTGQVCSKAIWKVPVILSYKEKVYRKSPYVNFLPSIKNIVYEKNDTKEIL